MKVQPLDTSSVGEHVVNYMTVDSSGKWAPPLKVVIVMSTILSWSSMVTQMSFTRGNSFSGSGVTVTDSDGNELDNSTVKITGEVIGLGQELRSYLRLF